MTENTATASAPAASKPAKKTVSKKTAAKKTAKKGTKKSPKKKVATPRGKTIRLRVFELLNKSGDGLTGAKVMEKLGLSGIPSVLKHEAMRKGPRIGRKEIEGVRGVVYHLTAAGKKALEKGTVDSDPAPTSVGKSDLVERS